ncbi:hypothetical protein AERO8C_160327 [Aeromonas veronii]|uniref:Uncharacterized protein n=1 Tax=Aeromonas veronii TaxID=654 RepID=A0A653L038_AERVE|nr:hypothetical protein AERO8C_160327 [Aeromonas veronii]
MQSRALTGVRIALSLDKAQGFSRSEEKFNQSVGISDSFKCLCTERPTTH